MSPRNFARAFRAQTGVTPARYVESVRLEAARRRLEETAEPVAGDRALAAASRAPRRCAAASCARCRSARPSTAAAFTRAAADRRDACRLNAKPLNKNKETPMKIAIPLYDRFTALDAIGPYEVLSRLPGARVTFVAAEAGPVRTDNGMLTLEAERSLAELPATPT